MHGLIQEMIHAEKCSKDGVLKPEERAAYGRNPSDGEMGGQPVEQGGVSVNGNKVTDTKIMYQKEAFAEEFIIKKGKKSFHKICC